VKVEEVRSGTVLVGSEGGGGEIGNSVDEAEGGGQVFGEATDGEAGGGSEDEEQVVEDTEAMVQEAMRRLPPGLQLSTELRPCDISEDQVVEDFMQRGCLCKKFKGRFCSEQFTVDHVKKTRLGFRELSSSDLDCVFMGKLIAFTNQWRI
jgi:hypothetical protein